MHLFPLPSHTAFLQAFPSSLKIASCIRVRGPLIVPKISSSHTRVRVMERRTWSHGMQTFRGDG